VPEKGEQPRPKELHGPHGHRTPHGAWGKRVPPMFEMWHKRAHEQERQAPQPAAI
jgi:hypothetical protein